MNVQLVKICISLIMLISLTFSMNIGNETGLSSLRYKFLNDQVMPALFNNTEYLVFINSNKTEKFMQILVEKLIIYENILREKSLLHYR